MLICLCSIYFELELIFVALTAILLFTSSICSIGMWFGDCCCKFRGDCKSVVMELFLVGFLVRMLGSGVDLVSEVWI